MELRTRKPNRLKEYDYSAPGCYFITICVKERTPFLRRGAHCAPAFPFPPLTDIGELVDRVIREIPSHYSNTRIEKYVIMPNHIHLLLSLLPDNNGRTMCAPTPKRGVDQIVKAMKETVTKQIGYSIWQKGFYDHIVRNDSDYYRIWKYIDNNPAKWREDCYYEEMTD